MRGAVLAASASEVGGHAKITSMILCKEAGRRAKAWEQYKPQLEPKNNDNNNQDDIIKLLHFSPTRHKGWPWCALVAGTAQPCDDASLELDAPVDELDAPLELDSPLELDAPLELYGPLELDAPASRRAYTPPPTWTSPARARHCEQLPLFCLHLPQPTVTLSGSLILGLLRAGSCLAPGRPARPAGA